MRQSDDETARRLLEILAEEPLPPSRVNIAALVQVGRRRARARRLIGLSGAVVVTVAALAVVPVLADVATRERPAPADEPVAQASAQPDPVEPTSCQPAPLPVPADTLSSQVLGGDPSGRYLVGTATGGNQRTSVLRWDDGRLQVLDIPVTDPAHLAVNSRGDVAGDGYFPKKLGGQARAWTYRDGRFADLPAVSGPPVAVVGINERGDVLGTISGAMPLVRVSPEAKQGSVEATAGPPNASTAHQPNVPAVPNAAEQTKLVQPVVWPGDQPDAVRSLRLPESLMVVNVQAVDDTGTVIGTGRSLAGSPVGASGAIAMRGLIWAPDGSVRELAAPSGHGPDTLARSVRGDWVVGAYQSSAEPTVGARWNLRTGEVRPMALKYMTGVNRAGWAAGYVLDERERQAPAVAFDQRIMVLPIPAKFDRNEGEPITVTISDDGRQIGSVLRTKGRPMSVAFRWTCT
ncbi:hypothetical protein BDK92_4519 [Micromonospora pisi]|uniref:Uncharacterized protein n=1 Tax=Micromonospora pisi TaxID=589240 RepID=A0A495JMU7_9ACTN|nr:hypothetical protein [Micromonospora pisi]RKR90151.1 hypothetical protein BDK92_4519 [Micromonospora pisi]